MPWTTNSQAEVLDGVPKHVASNWNSELRSLSLCTKRSWHHYVSVDHQLFLPMLSVKLNFDKACIMKNVSEKGSTKASASEQIECNRGKIRASRNASQTNPRSSTRSDWQFCSASFADAYDQDNAK
mmetsp:Transcript_167720/g.538644  ORF Transcript_167720/g.538644 Transcript_167720/m.538644 type:complete len:126 (-) Transcript_167720:97-474(-)